jgi:signal transduction histidine kinase
VAVSDTGPVKIVTAADEAATWGNPVLLERLVQNLIENAP